MTNVLLSCAGRRVYLVDYFRAALAGSGRVIGTDMSLTAPAMAACDVARQVPACAAPDYLDRLKQAIRAEKADLVFSLNDLELELLAGHRDAIEAETGAVLYVPSVETAAIGADKWRSFLFAREHGIGAPPTFLRLDDALAALARGELRLPVMVKPRWGSASIGLARVETAAELPAAIEACRAAIARSILAATGLEDAVIVQQCLEGPEYGVDILFGRHGDLLGFAAKRKLAMRAGETDKAVTVAPERFAPMVDALARHLSHRGNLDCDFMEHEGALHLIELNTRFGGGYPFTQLAGADHVGRLLAEFEGRPMPPYRYEVGRAFAKYDMLVEVPAP